MDQEHKIGTELQAKVSLQHQQQVKVLFFAKAREIAGLSEFILEFEPSISTSVNDCMKMLMKRFPGLEEISSCSVIALNQEYVDDTVLVKSGDELALIPPISGG